MSPRGPQCDLLTDTHPSDCPPFPVPLPHPYQCFLELPSNQPLTLKSSSWSHHRLIAAPSTVHPLPLDVNPPKYHSHGISASGPQMAPNFSAGLSRLSLIKSDVTGYLLTWKCTRDPCRLLAPPCLPFVLLPLVSVHIRPPAPSVQPSPSATPPGLAQAFPNLSSYHSDSYALRFY